VGLAGRVGIDGDAFAAIYEGYADPVFGACVSILRDRDDAADATQDVFVLAFQRIGQLRDPDRLRPWLFAIARHVCFRRLRERGRAQPVESVEPVVVDEEMKADGSAAAASALVWAAAAGLTERDRGVLYFNVVQGLEGADLAAALGVDHANPHSLLYRARAHLDRAVGVLVVARLGRRDCAVLDALLRKWDGTLTPILRKRVGRHIDGCAACTQAKARAYKAPALTAALLSVAPPAHALTAAEMFEIASRRPTVREWWQRDGFPPLDERTRRRRRVVLFAVTALGVALLLVGGTAMLGDASPAPARRPTDAAPANAIVVSTTRRSAPSTSVAPVSTTTLVAGITAATPTTVRAASGSRSPPVPQSIGGAVTATATTVTPVRPTATTTPHKPPPPTTSPPPTSTTTTTIHT
jgi:RNA polymerase sigma factor (sigma-70 family)